MNLSSKAIEELLASASDAMLVAGNGGQIVFLNPQAERLFGYRRDELLGQKIEILLPEDLRGVHLRQRENYRRAPHARPLFSGLELKARRKDGQIFDAEIALTPIEEDDELLIASTIRHVDRSNSSAEHFRQLLTAAPDAMIIVDQHGRMAIVNDQAEKMFGYSRDELLGNAIETLLPKSLRERHVSHRAAYDADPRLRPMGMGMDLKARHKDGSEFPVEISLSHIDSANGRFVSSVIRDVTERKLMEAELIEARQAAERAHKANTAFLAAASHDLRQPVQALSLLNGALRRTVQGDNAAQMVESQQQSLDAMTNLLNSLLDISRLDSGSMKPEFEEFAVRRLVDRLSAEFARQARQKRLTFVAEPNGTVIRSDPNMLAEIIQNLVSNAIRYTPEGQVSLTLRKHDGCLSIDVTDTGIGIPKDQQEEIFREFHQLDNASAPNAEGFGLGLAIVRRLADLLGHEIVVDSTPGEGSRFSVLVPIVDGRQSTSAAESEREPVDRSQAEGVVVLFEDDRRVADAWTMLLRADGFRVLTAQSAGEAERVARELGEAPDLIVSDFHLLDDSDGVQAITTLRTLFDRNIPSFVVSGDTSKVVDAAKTLGNSRLLAKPVHSDELLQLARDAIRTGTVPNS